jgi:transposase-like protein
MSRGAHVRKRSEWLDRLRRFSRSNSSVTEFCRREKVSVPSYYQWRRKLADATSGADARRQPATFIPVHVASSADLQVTFPNGARLTLPAHTRQHVQVFIESIAMARTTQGDA